uniref:Uncharacterized protein n=1 Tax=Pundamilia nyererei TaxID=303518 RepID=A0A3B4G7L7_9CICH
MLFDSTPVSQNDSKFKNNPYFSYSSPLCSPSVQTLNLSSADWLALGSLQRGFPSLHPTMQLSSHECDRTLDPFSTVHLFILTPSSTTTPAPMVTFGPMVQFSPICAVGSFREEEMGIIIIMKYKPLF